MRNGDDSKILELVRIILEYWISDSTVIDVIFAGVGDRLNSCSRYEKLKPTVPAVHSEVPSLLFSS